MGMSKKPVDWNNCPILEETGDGRPCGRCWYWLGKAGICPRHGDVTKWRDRYVKTGRLTPEREMRQARDSGDAT